MDYKYKTKSKFDMNGEEFLVEFERKDYYIWASTIVKKKRITAYAYNKENAFLNLKQAVYMILNVKFKR